jgi:Fic family protein
MEPAIMTYEGIKARWREYNVRTESDIDRVLHNFRILFAYHSGKIENSRINFHDSYEIFQSGKVNSFTGDVNTLIEQKNQKDCYEILRSKIAAKEPLSLDLIKRVHFELTKGTYDERRYLINGERPGEWKKHDYVVGRNEIGSKPAAVENELNDLIDEMNSAAATRDPLKAACYFHGVFELIHPFADGNGRAGRTLMNYYLMIHNHPPLVVRNDTKNEYYSALEKFQLDEDIAPLYEYMKTECIETWNKRGTDSPL